MWIYKAISDFGPVQFKDVMKLSHSLFYIKLNKEGGKNSQRLFFSAKASIENMRKLVYSTLKAVEWESKQHTITICSRLASIISIDGNSIHLKTSMIRYKKWWKRPVIVQY